MVIFKLKALVVAGALVLAAGGTAYATGNLPVGKLPSVIGNGVAALNGIGTSTTIGHGHGAAADQYGKSAAGNQYGVSQVARGKNDTGTMTLPNGKVIRNHGLAVRNAARQQAGNGNMSGDMPPVTVPAGPPAGVPGPPAQVPPTSPGSTASTSGSGNAGGHMSTGPAGGMASGHSGHR